MSAPKITSEQQLTTFFKHIDVDNNGTLSPKELQRVLLNGDWSAFNLDTIELLFSLFDSDKTGTIHFNEFVGLWRYIEDWKRIFSAFDADNSGTIEIPELITAMKNFGFNISEQMLKKFVKKYKVSHNVQGRKLMSSELEHAISFDNFVQLCVTVRSLTEVFRTLDKDGSGWAKMSYEQFLEVIVKNK
ncbi:20101_t:CDS:1 [Funneliformis geosporum]|uniref:12137_t:CDS:1 n=1 Tax=Funneliformis geosporum TaxID=1117311 RepID=A0A9W4SMW1_9GLOM|nr:20101_t:CDS:1 [Funneliformis geosporum]CAI2175084.1 12137_t:CDS:1 [Funneliformis geosporum]